MDESAAYHGKVQAQITDETSSALRRYQRVVIGSDQLWFLLGYEIAMLACNSLPGAAGLWLRKLILPRLMGHVGRGVVFGRNITLRHPQKITLGNNVVVDEDCVLDGRGHENEGIKIGNDVILARNTILGCKNGNITLGDNVGIGAHSTIHAVGQSGVSIGNNVAIGAYTYLVGGSHYHVERTDIPITYQGLDLRGGIRIEDNVWLGARVTVLDGVTIGRGAIIGAGAVVTKDVPDLAIAMGIPASVVRYRS